MGFLMDTYYVPLVADLFLFNHERNFMLSLPEICQASVSETFDSVSRYLDCVL